jgi:hypothetical protein
MNNPNPIPSGPSANDWQPIAAIPGLWEIRGLHGVLPLRAVAVQLGANVCVYSPLPSCTREALAQLGSLGEPILLAPNAYHTLGLRPHSQAFPQAPVVASTRALARVERKSGLKVQDLSVLEAKLPPHVSLLRCPGARTGEVWLSVRGTDQRAWVVCDAFLNLQRAPKGVLGLIVKGLRLGPGLSISTSFKWLVKNRKAYRDWLLARIAEEQPTILVPSHGQILNELGLPRQMEQLVRARL